MKQQIHIIAATLLLIQSAGIASGQWQWAENVTRVGAMTLGRNVVDLAVSGEYAYCADNYGLSVWDLSEPERPVEIARRPTPGLAMCVTVQGDYAFIGDFHKGLAVFDISNPESPTLASYLRIDEFTYSGATPEFRIVIQQQSLYLFAGFGLWIVAINDPLNPEIAGRWIPGAL